MVTFDTGSARVSLPVIGWPSSLKAPPVNGLSTSKASHWAESRPTVGIEWAPRRGSSLRAASRRGAFGRGGLLARGEPDETATEQPYGPDRGGPRLVGRLMVAVLRGASSPDEAEAEESGAEKRESGRLGDLDLRDANGAFRHYLESLYESEPVERASDIGRS